MHDGLLEKGLELASTYGYALLFAASLAENIFLLGFVIPGDLVVVLGGALVAAHEGLQPIAVALTVIVGVVVGSNLSFWLGRRGGSALVERWGNRFLIDHGKIQRVEAYFGAHGAKTVFLACFISGLKNMVPTMAGASRMGFSRFFLYNTVGSALRSLVLLAVGYLFGANLPRAVQVAKSVNGWALMFVTVLILAGLTFQVLSKRRRLARETGEKNGDRVDGGAAP